MVKLLLKNNADYNAQAKNGLAAIHLCAQEDRINVAEILASKGADMNAVTKAGYSPLHVATHFGSISIVKYLLDQQVEVSYLFTFFVYIFCLHIFVYILGQRPK